MPLFLKYFPNFLIYPILYIMSSSALRGVNTTNIPLQASGAFVGGFEFAGSLLSVVVNCFATTAISVAAFECATTDYTKVVPISTTTIPANTTQDIQIKLNFPYFKIIVTNLDAIVQTQMNINTIYTNLLPLGAAVTIDNTDPIPVSFSGPLPAGNNIIGYVRTLNVPLIQSTFDGVDVSMNVPYYSDPVDISQYSTWDYVISVGNNASNDPVAMQVRHAQLGYWITLASVPFTDGVSYLLNQTGAALQARFAIINPTSDYRVYSELTAKTY